MSKSNLHKKLTHIDSFARKYYGKHSRLAVLRQNKKLAKKQFRRKTKELASQTEIEML